MGPGGVQDKALLPSLWGTATGLLNGVTSVVAEFVPDSVPRPIVDVAVKAGLVLAALNLARSLLSVRRRPTPVVHVPVVSSRTPSLPLAAAAQCMKRPSVFLG